MLYRFVCLAIAAHFLLCSLGQAKSSDPVFDQIDSTVRILSNITGLSEKHPVPYGRMSKEQLRRFVDKRISRSAKPKEIYADELALKMFGFVPQNFDLRQSTIDLLTEQAAAFYDYDRKRLFLLDGSSPDEQSTTLAHELAHALADQHFHLNRFMDDTAINDDENLARTAVVEGQASWLMIAYDLVKVGKEPAPTPEMLKTIAESDASSLEDYPVLKTSPLYIRQSLLFPYTEGTLFFDAVYRRMGKAAFAYVFTHPPSDTGQILHPERYFERIQATSPELPNAPLPLRKAITGGNLGEFDHQVLLEQYVGAREAKALSPHLIGGDFQIATGRRDHRPVLEYVSQWDSPAEASTFFRAYQKVLQRKWKHCDPSVVTENTFAGSGDNGLFVTRLSGEKMWSIEGLGSAEEWTTLQQLSLDRAAQGL